MIDTDFVFAPVSRSSEAEAKLESVRDNLYSPVQNNQFFNPVMPQLQHHHQHQQQHQGLPQLPIHHSQVDGGGGVHTSSRLSPMRQLQRSLQTHAQPSLNAHIPPPMLPPAASGGASSTLAALKFFNTEEYPNQPIYGTQFGVVAPLAIMKETDIEKVSEEDVFVWRSSGKQFNYSFLFIVRAGQLEFARQGDLQEEVLGAGHAELDWRCDQSTDVGTGTGQGGQEDGH